MQTESTEEAIPGPPRTPCRRHSVRRRKLSSSDAGHQRTFLRLRHGFPARIACPRNLARRSPIAYARTRQRQAKPISPTLDINNSGQIVGDVSDAQSKTHGILYSNGQFTDIGGFVGNFSIAVAINESGQIVGSSNLPGNGAGHAFRYSNGSMQDLGTLGGTSSSAADINAPGQVVGSSSLPGNASTHAFVDTDGRMIDLGSLGRPFGGATAINASGRVVGSAGIYGERIPFVYDGTTMSDLNNLLDASGAGWTVSNATDINDAGWIAAEGNFNGGVFHVLLTPVTESTAGDLLGAAIMILGGFAWRRRRFCSGKVPGRRPITRTAARPD
jgi:probable HAF family extracellular repeat protein